MILDPQFKELVRLNGIPSSESQIGKSNFKVLTKTLAAPLSCVDSRCTNEGKYFLWFKGGKYVSLVNTVSLKFMDIRMIKGSLLVPPVTI